MEDAKILQNEEMVVETKAKLQRAIFEEKKLIMLPVTFQKKSGLT